MALIDDINAKLTEVTAQVTRAADLIRNMPPPGTPDTALQPVLDGLTQINTTLASVLPPQ